MSLTAQPGQPPTVRITLPRWLANAANPVILSGAVLIIAAVIAGRAEWESKPVAK